MTVSRAHGDTRREALLDAALACFEDRGLVQTRMEDVRQAAGASPSSVYHFFKGLPELIAALLERTFVRRYAEVTAKVVRTRTAKAAVAALVEAHLTWVFKHPIEARFMYRALALDLDGGYREGLRQTKEQLKADMNGHLSKLGVVSGAGSAEGILEVVLLGMTHQACRTWLSAPHTIDQGWMKRTLPKLTWRTALAVMPRSKVPAR